MSAHRAKLPKRDRAARRVAPSRRRPERKRKGDTAGEGGVGSVGMRAGDTPLIDAARHGRVADVAALLAGGADVDEPKTDGSGVTALYIACQEGHAEVVTILLDAGANVNQADKRGQTRRCTSPAATATPRASR